MKLQNLRGHAATPKNVLFPPPRPRAFYVSFDALVLGLLTRPKPLAALALCRTLR
jgi:hypothetical protein